MSEQHMARVEEAWEAFDHLALKRVCEMKEEEFGPAYGMTKVNVPQVDHDYYFFRDNGSPILAVAHLDTVISHERRTCTFANTAAGPIVHSGALDDRLGAYIILELLPALGIQYDVLLTIGEESGMSTAGHFETEKDYHWMIEFDRGGTDVVMYQYEDDATAALVKACGARVETGIFSDISYLEHLGIKGFNWGVGYQDYHGPRGHAYLADTMQMLGHYLGFHEVNREVALPHTESAHSMFSDRWWGGGYSRYGGTSRCGECGGNAVDPTTEWCEACGNCQVCWRNALEEECVCGWAIQEREGLRREQERISVEEVGL